jgi:hypothetical protein
MKTRIAVAICGAVIVLAGCVSTVNDRKTPGVPFVKDRIEGRYDRSVDQVFSAAKKVVMDMGAMINEGTLYNQTNVVKTVEGQINQRKVWVRIEGLDANITSVIVQTRTKGGGGDIELAAQVKERIALALTAGR